MTDFRCSASLEVLRARADLLRKTRAFFDSRGFVEVQTPLLSADTVVDRHLDPIPVTLPRDPRDLRTGERMWLQTSPEFAMKRLLASGATAIYQIAPAFRIGERGHQHNPEFTMLEWYRCGDTMRAGIALLADFVAGLLGAATPAVRTVRQAFVEYAGLDPFTCTAGQLRQHALNNGVAIPESLPDTDWDGWFDVLFVQLVQPQLGKATADIVHDYPSSQAALARIRPDEPPVAERFELFVDGCELANGYSELLDAEELLRRNHEANRQRVTDGKPELPVESRLLDAMRSGLPPCCGVALGFDRLVMLAVGAAQIGEVLCFPIDTA